jgi:hypothetical protein
MKVKRKEFLEGQELTTVILTTQPGGIPEVPGE